MTVSPVSITANARVVGIPIACMASLTRYSRNIGPRHARPSELPLENGVRPDPLRCTSRSKVWPSPRSTATSPSSTARPSPKTGEKLPNWCPEYACATGCGHAASPLWDSPSKNLSPSPLRSHSGSKPSSSARESLRRRRVASSEKGTGDHGAQRSGSASANREDRGGSCGVVEDMSPTLAFWRKTLRALLLLGLSV